MFARMTLTFLVSFAVLYTNAQARFVAFAGPQITSAKYTVRDAKQPVDYKFGFTAGGALKVVFDNHLYFFPSISYSLKGYQVVLKDTAFPPTVNALNNNTTIHTIELCPMFHFDFNKRPSHLFVRIGAAVDAAISGSETFDSVDAARGIVHVTRPMKFSFTEYGLFTASANLHLGYESGKGLMIWAFYNHGIGSLNNADQGPTILHRIFGVSFGWTFGTPMIP
jgi:hypothetical protein